MTNQPEKPIRTLRDGLLKAVIWKNTNEKRTFYSVQFIRSYRDEQTNEWRDSQSFSNGEILKLARLAGQAYDTIASLRGAEKGGAQ